MVDFESNPNDDQFIELVIHNIGRTVARNVRVSFDRPLESSEETPGYKLSESASLRDGIPTMPPGKRVTAFFDSSLARHKTDLPRTYRATVTYEDYKGRPQEPAEFVLDLNFRVWPAVHADVRSA